MLALQQIASQLPAWIQWVQAIAISAGSVGTASAIIFAVYKFFRQGQNDPRLQPSVNSELTATRNSIAYILATVTVVNVGQVDVELELEPSGVAVFTKKDGHDWEDLELPYDVFIGQRRVQPNAELEHQVWIELPYQDEVAIGLELTVAGYTITKKEIQTWQTTDVIPLIESEESGNFSSNG